MQRTVKGKVGDTEAVQRVFMMDLKSDTREISFENAGVKEKDGGQVHADLEKKSKSSFISGEKLGAGGKDCNFMDLDAGKEGGGDMLSESGVASEGDSSRNQSQNDGVRVFVTEVNDDACNRKRKRECILKLLNWVRTVAKDPCHQVIGSLPESSAWQYSETDYRNQCLLIRQAMMKRHDNSTVVQSIWQKKQKMHPKMFEDHSVRYSQRIASAKISQAVLSPENSQAQSCSKSASSNTQSDLELEDSVAGLWLNKYKQKIIRVGKYFQADVPVWTEKGSDSDCKWLGTRVWPQEQGVNSNCLIERDPTRFGRLESCGCEFSGSFECVRFHVSEKRTRLKLELGVAFYQWHIDQMGEEVAVSWNKMEQLDFEAIIKLNPPSQDKCFWEEICKYFHSRRRRQLVSYYFNVFLLRRRGLQNRSAPIEISSDDEDLEFETTTKCSGQNAVLRSPKPSYRSPKKTHLNPNM